MKKSLLFLFLFLFLVAFGHAQTTHVPTLESDNIFSGLNIFSYGDLQLQTAPPPCATGEFVTALDATFTPICGTPSGGGGVSPQPVLNASASTVAGSDIGAKVNTLMTQLKTAGQFGIVTVDPTVANGNQITTITIPLGETLDCQGAILTWPSSGYQIIYSGINSGGTQSKQGKIKNCTLVGQGGTATAVYTGGDPANVITPSTNYGNNVTLEHDVIEGFATGYTHGSNAYNNIISNTEFLDNTNNIISAPTNATNDGEATVITNGSVISNASNCGLYLNNGSDVYYISDSHLDYNTNGAVCGTNGNVQLQNDWEEQYFAPFINLTGVSTTSDYVIVQGGHAVTTAQAATITNVAIDGSNNLTLTTTASATGYVVGRKLNFSGLTTATFLNGTSGVIEGASGTTVVVTYVHASYSSASDTGTATPANADLWHVEGLNSFVNVDDVVFHLAYHDAVTAYVGLGSATTSTVCISRIINGNGPVAITGSVGEPCQWNSVMDIAVGSSAAKISPTNFIDTNTQGFNIAWSRELLGPSGGDMDFINIHGSGVGGFGWCDGAFGFTPSASNCQMLLSNAGALSTKGSLSVGGGAAITTSSAIAVTASSTSATGQALCVLNAGPPVQLGVCSSAVNSSGACTCH